MRTPKLALVIVLAAAAGLTCDDDGKSSGADGGGRGGTSTGGTGGSTATGGTGGSTATGGTGGTATGGTGGSTATGGTTGTGGTTATGGTGGTTATGGTGGTTATGGMGGSATGGTGGASANCEVPCLTSLITNCQPMGMCMSQTTLIPLGVNQCYTNGVKVSLSANLTSPTMGTAVITYRKDGNVCYSIETPVSEAGGGMGMFTVKNAAGAVVATGAYGAGGSMPTVTCTGGMTYNLSNPNCVNVPRPSIPGMGGGDAGAGSCPMGTCL